MNLTDNQEKQALKEVQALHKHFKKKSYLMKCFKHLVQFAQVYEVQNQLYAEMIEQLKKGKPNKKITEQIAKLEQALVESEQLTPYK